MTRAAMLLWSAASGLVIGLLAGVGLVAVLALVVNVVPGISERLVARVRIPVVVVLLVVVPLIATVLGYLEGRAKLP
jgi:hypothetical protein